MSASIKTKLSEWIAQNPLRKWRKEQGLTLQDVSQLVGKATYSVSSYENCRFQPSEDTMEKLARITGKFYFARTWRAWLARKPTS